MSSLDSTSPPSNNQAWDVISHHLGKLTQLLEHPDVVELMVNPDGSVWVETHSRGKIAHGQRLGADARRSIIEAVAYAAGKVCNEDSPEVGDIVPVLGARFQGLVPPAVHSPAFAIRLPSSRIIPLTEYVSSGTLTAEQSALLEHAIAARHNILVAGGTGSGKTTFSNALLELIGQTGHRVMTIEDTPELRCPAPDTVPVFVDRQGAFRYRDALFVALRMSPDRIVVGELRDGLATLELLKCWNTGHGGGLATIHANSAASALPRVEQLLEEVIAKPPKALIAEALHVVVYMERFTDENGVPGRRVVNVARVKGWNAREGSYELEHAWHTSANRSS